MPLFHIKVRPVKEIVIAADIRDFLELQRYVAIRCVAGPTRARRDQETPENGNPPGFPDWCFAKPTEVLFIEVKRPGERPSLLQIAWLTRLRGDGYTAEWFDDFNGAYGGKKPFMDWWQKKG